MKQTCLYLVVLALAVTTSVHGATVVNFGEVRQFSGPGDLDLSGNMVKAVNFNGADITVAGVTFASDAGDAELVGPQNVVGWQTRPEYGATADDDNLESIMHDIRWANSGASEFLEAHIGVTTGQEYKVQLLISGNHPENRVWDIEVEGAIAIDELTSLGLDTDTYDIGRSIVYTHTFTAGDNTLDIVMGNVSGDTVGADLNPIWQALTVEAVPEPSTGLLLLVGLTATLLGIRRQRTRALA